jgi:nucleotidyltransferase AbiEii toxin of type IV toxin-antitoxin system
VELQPEWHEFLHALKRHGVRFLLVGAHALAAHGRPRFTQDLDVLVDPTPANARRVSAAIAEFGFKETARDWRWFARPYHITMIGRVPMRIDVLTSISGVSFRTAWRNRSVASTTFGDVPVLGLAELRANKLASGRPKDLVDVALLDELAPARKPAGTKRRKRPAARGSRRRPAARHRRTGR